MYMKIQHIFRYKSENKLKDKDETPPLEASLPSKAHKKKVAALEPEESSSDGERVRIRPRRGMSTGGVRRLNTVIFKGPGNYSHFASCCWGEFQGKLRTRK